MVWKVDATHVHVYTMSVVVKDMQDFICDAQSNMHDYYHQCIHPVTWTLMFC